MLASFWFIDTHVVTAMLLTVSRRITIFFTKAAGHMGVYKLTEKRG